MAEHCFKTLIAVIALAAAAGACRAQTTAPAEAPTTRSAPAPIVFARPPTPPAYIGSVCVSDAAAALQMRLALDARWSEDSVAGAMYLRQAHSGIATHSLATLQAGLARYAPVDVAALVTFVGADETCSWVISSKGIEAYGRSGLSRETVEGDVRDVIAALGVAGAGTARAPTRRAHTPASPSGGAPQTAAQREASAPTAPATTPTPAAAGANANANALSAALENVSQSLFPDDVARAIARYHAVIIVPHQVYFGFPFALVRLPAAAGGHFLIDTTEIQVAPALGEIGIGAGLNRGRDTALARVAPEARRHLLAESVIVGDPPYADEEFELRNLPGAALEAHDVAGALGADPIPPQSARLQTVLARLAGAEKPIYLHFATHGVADFQGVDYNRSFVALADGDRLNPQALAGIHLREGTIVVLSACQSGLGVSRPGGTIGLSRMFQLANAQTVIMSLWNVDDDATRFMMGAFARELASSGQAPLAYAVAVRETRKRYPEPGLWASFVDFGVGPF